MPYKVVRIKDSLVTFDGDEMEVPSLHLYEGATDENVDGGLSVIRFSGCSAPASIDIEIERSHKGSPNHAIEGVSIRLEDWKIICRYVDKFFDRNQP